MLGASNRGRIRCLAWASLAVFCALEASAAPVKLSSCTLDANRNVTIGPSGCGPQVYVDQSFTGPQALGFLTIATGGQLTFPSGQTLQVDTTGIAVSGLLGAGAPGSPIGSGSVATLNFVDPLATGAAPPSGATKGITVN